MKKMIGDKLPKSHQKWNKTNCRNYLLVNVVLWFPLFQISQSFGQMIVQGDSFVPKLADKQIFVFDLFLEWQSFIKLLSCRLERAGGLSGFQFCILQLLLKTLYLPLRVFDKFA